MTRYFAYGSNLHPIRLMERAPSANLVDVVELRKYCLNFHTRSNDGSSKCNMVHTGFESDVIFGAIYEIDVRHQEKLHHFEGNGYGYIDSQIRVQHLGQEHCCYTYVAQQTHIVDNLKPYHWYKQLVVLGAKYLRLPNSYILSIESVESIEDHDEKRKRQNETLIQKIKTASV